jgi:O-antigen/teichoic acid export membrane protein
MLLVAASLDTDFVHYATQTTALRNIMQSLTKLTSVVGTLFLVTSPNDHAVYAAMAALPAFFLSVGSSIYSLKRFGISAPNPDRMAKFFRRSFEFGITLFLFTLLDRYDVLLVSYFFDEAAVGIYSGQMRLIQSISTAASSFGIVFYAEMLGTKDHENLSNLIAKSLWIMACFVSPVACGIWFVSGDVLQLMYSESFVPYKHILSILATSSFAFIFVHVLGHQFLTSQKRIKQYNSALLIALLVGAMSGMLLLKPMGLTGIATSNLLTKILASCLLFWFAKDHIKPLVISMLARVAVPSLLMIGALLFVQDQNLWIKIAIGAAVYLPSLVILNRQNLASLS